jgi:FkbM family methyltransferase
MRNIISSMANSIVRACYPYGCIRRILVGPLRGTRFKVTPSMGLSYALGGQSLDWTFLARRIAPGMVVYDIGGNKGQMALFFSRMVGDSGKVYTFEPAPRMFSLLEENLAMNSIDNVTACNIALADRDGSAEFLYSDDDCTEGRLAVVATTAHLTSPESFTVPVACIDTLISTGFPAPDLLKIDVEGAAPAVLRGARSLIETCSPSIYIELHGPEELQSLKEYLMPHGYRIETIDGRHVPDPTEQWHEFLWCHREKSGPVP